MDLWIAVLVIDKLDHWDLFLNLCQEQVWSLGFGDWLLNVDHIIVWK